MVLLNDHCLGSHYHNLMTCLRETNVEVPELYYSFKTEGNIMFFYKEMMIDFFYLTDYNTAELDFDVIYTSMIQYNNDHKENFSIKHIPILHEILGKAYQVLIDQKLINIQ